MSARRFADALAAATAAVLLVGAVFFVRSRHVELPPGAWGFRGFPGLFAVAFGVVGWLITSRRPRNAVGWLMGATGFGSALQFSLEQYAIDGLVAHAGELPAAPFAAWVLNWIWVPVVVPALVYLFLLFPTGRPSSPAWRWLARLAPAPLLVSVVGIALTPGPLQNIPFIDNPYAVEMLPDDPELYTLPMLPLFLVVVASVVSLVLRLREARGEERQQLKWFVTAAVVVGVCLLPSGFVAGSADPGSAWQWLWPLVVIVAMMLIPVAVGIGILRHRLFDLDLAINRALVVSGLVAFVTAVYAAVVGGVGALVGGRANLLLSVVTTGLVAVGFQPVRERVQHLANRMVYGERATPYEVLSSFTSRLEESLPTDDLLARIAKLLVDGTGASAAEVWLRVGDRLRPAASWPDAAAPSQPLAVRDDRLPAFDGVGRVAPVVHRGELLGAITVTAARGETLHPTEEKLVDDLAAQAGLLLRNQRLTAELLELVEELRASRQRLVAAQDEERRRLERDLHDGAQQLIVALKLRATLVRSLVERGDAARATELLDQVVADADEAVAALRELAHGIYPPLLESDGLVAALTARARRSPLDVRVEAPAVVGRFPREVESAVYFCVLEALQNAAKYAGAATVEVRLAVDGGDLVVEVADDGRGFDLAAVGSGRGLTNMRDRLDALGGALEVRSAPGRGCRVVGRVPVPDRDADRAAPERAPLR